MEYGKSSFLTTKMKVEDGKENWKKGVWKIENARNNHFGESTRIKVQRKTV